MLRINLSISYLMSSCILDMKRFFWQAHLYNWKTYKQIYQYLEKIYHKIEYSETYDK